MRLSLQLIFFFIFLIKTTSCTKDEAVYQLSDEKLTAILTDLHVSESATQHLSLAFRDSMVVVYLGQILEIHEVSKEVFEPEYQKLKRDPKKLQVIYEKVIKRLEKMKLKKKVDKKDKMDAPKKNAENKEHKAKKK